MKTIGRADFGEPIIQSRLQIGTCGWWYNNHFDSWETQCGHVFGLPGYNPGEDAFIHCPFCGGKIEVKDE